VENTTGHSGKAKCNIVFGVLAESSNSNEQAYFNFVIFKNIYQIQNDVPANGYVSQGNFTYFLYYSSCSNCSMIIALSSFANGNPDLYVIKETREDPQLPTLTNYDFKSASLTSETLSITSSSKTKNRHTIGST